MDNAALMGGAIYSTYEIRTRAVQAVLDEQLAVRLVAQAYGTDRSTIHRWIARYRAAGGDQGLLRRPVSGRPRVLEEERQEWRRTKLPKIRAAVRKYRAILYFQDEANISLTALLGKTWAPRGKTPKQTVTGKRGGVSAMSAITRRGRLIFRLHEKRITSEEVIDFLSQMLRHHKRRHLVVVMDQAPPHVSHKTNAFIDGQPRLHVFHLPKYSPDWNPDEKVWNHLKHQELKGHQARTKAELKELAHNKLEKLSNSNSRARGVSGRFAGDDGRSSGFDVKSHGSRAKIERIGCPEETTA